MHTGTQPENFDLLLRALQRQARATLTAGEGPTRFELTVEFLAPSQEADAPGFFAVLPDGKAPFLDHVIAEASPASFWFQEQDRMVLFQSILLKKRRRGLGKKLLLVAWPQQITLVEERHQARRVVRDSFNVSAGIQVLSPTREIDYETVVRIWDITTEGASIICHADPTLMALSHDSWIKILIRRDHERQFTLTAGFRHIRKLPHDKLRIGLQFLPSGDPASIEAKAALEALIAELQAPRVAIIPPANAA